MSDIVPTFNVDSYKNGLVTPAIWWAVLQVLWLIFSFIDTTENAAFDDASNTLLSAYAGFGIEVLLLFGAWAGISVARSGGNAGDGLIAGILLGLVAWIIWFILFGFINPPGILQDDLTFGDPDFADDLLPMLWNFILYHGAGAVTVSGLMGGKE
ncbi:MAG: hypothetical protein ACW99A_16910 [Candidatus Kariarchaeaceae archaeon]|jgi:hypothetical protein